jgi:pimeloyl-ACP methyl ester carboxylesterase
VPPGRIVLFGRSLGGAVAAWLATRSRPGGLIVESTFRSVPALASELYPFLPVRALARLSYDAEASLAQAECPTLVVHSVDDEIIPYDHARALHAAARNARGLVTLSGGHNDGFLRSRDVYLGGLAAFLDELGLSPPREAPPPAPRQ